MRTGVAVLLTLVAVLFVSGCGGKRAAARAADADNDRVEFLGERKVNFGGDVDTILVGANDGLFRAIRIEVDGSALEMWDIDVHFGNGGHEDFNTRLHFEEGSWSRRIDLRGGERIIKKVVFKYKSKNRKTGRATVKLYGIG